MKAPRKPVLGTLAILLPAMLLLASPAFAEGLEDKPAPPVSELFWQMIDQARWGEPEAQYSVGMMYLAGQGVEKNPTEAAKWLQKAADQGHAYAMLKMGELNEGGIGVQKDPSKAAAYYKKAAEKGVGSPDTKAYYEELRKAQLDALRSAQRKEEKEEDRKYEEQVRQEQYRHEIDMQRLIFRNWPEDEWWGRH